MPSTQRHIDTWQGPITVFLIGMRVNRWWKPWAWLPVIAAMGRMLRERRHLAVVRGAAGETLGLVTLEDLVEEFVGDIHDEHDEFIAGDR